MTNKKIACKHKWEHITKVGLNMREDECLWLFHRCSKCKMMTKGLLIKILKKHKTKKDKPKKSSSWWHW